MVAFVKDHAGIYDSITAEAANQSLEGTLMYKLLTICGTLLNTNKGKKKQVVWLEETRSTLLKNTEKSELLKSLGQIRKGIADDITNLMTIGIEIRL